MKSGIWMVAAALASACALGPSDGVDSVQAATIRKEVESAFRETYDLSKPGLADRMLAMYPTTGRIVSASGGEAHVSRDSIETGIRYFWSSVGANMREPQWIWQHFYIDVLSPTAAVVTATYRVPHKTPANEPHVIGGAMTSVMEKRGGKWLIIQEHLSDNPTPDSSMAMSMPGHQQ
jgi:hypothetical protein